MFNNQIASIQETISYHKSQIEIAEQELYSLKAAQEFALQATAQVQEALEHIETRYLELFKEHLLTLFEVEGREQPSQVDTISNVELVVEENTTTPPTRVKGLPNCGAATYIDIAPGIVYSSDEVCYMGFSDRHMAESYGRQLVTHEFTTGFIVEKPLIVIDAKWELRFHCSEDSARRLASLDLKQELTHPNNKSITAEWLLSVAACKNKPFGSQKCLFSAHIKGLAHFW